MAEVFAILATILELLLGVLLIIGLWTKWVALGSSVLALTFAICMMLAFGIRAPLDYSVFAVSAAGFFVATIAYDPWSIDNVVAKRRRKYEHAYITAERNTPDRFARFSHAPYLCTDPLTNKNALLKVLYHAGG